ncbi:adenylate/guanylate cyclase domain-containing protein [Flagellimonas sp. CMM7]|uniref:adenylate/guanylate cyclase domain-containing protein n=1 Tax=Flagellimonas sp. CMM7 TaxID=2654676 RepID=UPI0013D30DE6|nr:adenylate/guanylate cyclase domain-containing protein [Flagellimonas sp. CMM7]UII78784.1 GAF domain-containing protein [Flagellimonas sp. CMM7]
MIAPEIPKNEEERIEDLISLNLSDSEKKEQLDGIVSILSKSIRVPIAYISSIETDKQNIHASCGLNFNSSDRSSSFCGHTILQNELLVIEDTHKDERFFDNPMVVNEPKIRFYAGYPLSTQIGKNIGSLCISDTVPRKLAEDELSIFKMIGKLLNDMIRLNKMASLQKEIHESKKKLEVLNGELYESNRFHTELFGQYMSPSLLEKVLQNKKETQLGGEERDVTVLISDLRGFSPLSEQYNAQTIVQILNIYFEEMIDVIHKHDGYINEILGDGILVVFGAIKNVDNSALKAVECAREMQRGLKKVNGKLKIKGLPALEMGVGINSGNLVVGNIGSKRRMKYGVVGENINIAARIESLTVPGQVLISETLYKLIADKVKPIGNIRTKMKGFKEPIMIYDVSEDIEK